MNTLCSKKNSLIHKHNYKLKKANFGVNILNLTSKISSNGTIQIKRSSIQNDIEKIIIRNSVENTNKPVCRRKFTDEEDNVLKSAVNIFGTSSWKIVASLVPGRSPRQCRDRYTNYLAPGLVHLEWSDEEDKLLFDKYLVYGPKWTKIRQYFPSRSANDIKNRYNYTVSRKFQINNEKYLDEQFKAGPTNSESNDQINDCEQDQNNNFEIFNEGMFDINDIIFQSCFFYGNENIDQNEFDYA